MISFLPINRDTIIKYPNPILKQKSKDVQFPLTNETKNLILKMKKYLRDSNIEEIAMSQNLDPAIGIAAPQIGVNLNFFVLYILNKLDEIELEITVINPKVIAHSNTKIYIEEGEGCLSIPNKVDGYVHRYDIIEIEYQDEDGNKNKKEFKNFHAIAVQHEIDHLNGILYIDRINKEDPFKIEKNSKLIK